MKPVQHKLSARTASFQESVIREMMRLGESVGAISLSQGLPDYPTPQPVLEAARRAIQNGDNQYTFPFGELEFRKAIARKSLDYNHIQADPETEITVTCGVSEGIMAAIFALTEPGDEVLILEPWYENYLPACTLAGVTPKFIRLTEPDYHLDLQAVAEAVTARTRLIIVNTPHNPTGKVFTLQELHGLAQICLDHDLIAVTDEIYEYLVYDDHPHVSLAALPGMHDRTVTISGLGKSYAVTGWRVGWVLAAPRLTGLIRKVHDYMTICAPAPFQAAGIAALALDETFYEGMRQEYRLRREILLNGLQRAGFGWTRPSGAYYVMADFSAIEWPFNPQSEHTYGRQFAEYLARHAGVAAVPGDSFYWQPERRITTVRLNFAQSPKTIQDAVGRLEILIRTE